MTSNISRRCNWATVALSLSFVLLAVSDLSAQRVEKRNAAGQIVEAYTTVDNKRQGPYVSFYDNGAKNVETEYDAGNINGRYVTYHQNGKVAYETTFAAGQLTGTISEYYESGQLKTKGTTYGCRFGPNATNFPLKTGLWTTYHENGKKASEGEFVKDDRNGRWLVYHKNGNVYIDSTFEAGNLTGTYSEYYENGQLAVQGTTYGNKYGSPNNPLKTGLWFTCNQAGNLGDATNYVKDVAVGKASHSGAPECRAEVASKILFVRERNAGFEQVKELVYDQAFYVEAHYDVPPAGDRKEVKLEWTGQNRSIVVTKTAADPKVFRSERIMPKRPATGVVTRMPANTPAAMPVYRVIGVANDDQLTIRTGPGVSNAAAGQIPSGATGIRVMGEETKVGTATWIKVNYGGVVGWVNKRYLAR